VQHPRATATRAPTTPLRNHWQWRPEWDADRVCVLWYLTFETAPELSQQAERAQSLLTGIRAVDVVPPGWLHLTLDDVGFADEVLPAQLDAVVAAARESVGPWVLPGLTLGPVCAMEDSVVLRAGPGPELEQLRQRLRDATTDVLGADAASGLDPFSPHVTLAYLNDACDADTVLDPLATVCRPELVVAVARLTLAAVTRRDRRYEWTALAQLPLG
jgi:2'-5' RNA ligase